jgi:hypothetical protein
MAPGGSGTYTAAADGAGGGAQLISGNENLKSEKGQTWTMGLVLSSPFQHPLAERITATVDWYEARVDGPIDVRSPQSIVNACFNADGSNPTYDPTNEYCQLIERNPITGGLLRLSTPFDNYGKIIIRGMDVSLRWSAALADMGLPSVPGRLSVSSAANFLLNQKQALTAGGAVADYAGLNSASETQVNTTFGYSLEKTRASLTWKYRQGTKQAGQIAGTSRIAANPQFAGYHTMSLFDATIGRQFGALNASLSISNLLNTKPKTAGYDWRDVNQGFGTFDPNADLVGRRYSLNLSMDF